MKPIREVTNKIHAAIAEGTLDPLQVAEAALRFLSEDDVATMAHNEEFFLYEEEFLEGDDDFALMEDF